MAEITRGLIIAEPWIGRILAGRKTWEMRSRRTEIRGSIGLIRKGSGAVVGTAELLACHGPFPREQLLAAVDKHAISRNEWTTEELEKYAWAWELRHTRPLRKPVPYRHKSGAVIWVDLDDACRRQLAAAHA